MKTLRFFFLLILFISLCVSKAESQGGSQGQFAFFPGAESNTLSRDHFLSRLPVSENGNLHDDLPDISEPIPFSYALSVEASLAIFYYWLYGWFFAGKYVAYHSYKFIFQYPRTVPPTRPDKKVQLNKKHARVSKQSHKKHSIRRRRPSHIHGSPPPDFIPEKYQSLASSVSSQGITYKDLSTKNKPDDFPSDWVWIVIGWIDNALKQAQRQYLPDHSLDDVLANTDPALPAIVRGTLRAALFVEDADAGEPGGEFFSDKHVALTIGWMDYMFLHYNCPLNWREWLVAKPKFKKGSLLQSEREDLMTFDTSEEGVRSIARRLRLSDKTLNRMSQPRAFRSTGLWIIIEEFNSDELHCQNASGFSTIFPADLIFADTVCSVLFEIFSAASELTEKELYLMEFWLDMAVEHLQIQTRTFLEWRNLMTLAPNKPEYFAEHSPMDEVTQPSPSSEAINTPLVSTDFAHRVIFAKSIEKNQLLLFQLDELDTDESGDEKEDSDSDYERDGKGYFIKHRAK